MNNHEILNKLEEILISLEKLRFASTGIADFFDSEMEQNELIDYERIRLRPLNDIVLDYIAKTNQEVINLYADVETARLTEKDNQQYHART